MKSAMEHMKNYLLDELRNTQDFDRGSCTPLNNLKKDRI